MPEADHVQIHMLTSYPASLLNRDATGSAKRLPYGGAIRTRISSQCLKKHWREAEALQSLGDYADRSRLIFEERVARQLREQGVAEDAAGAITELLLEETVDSSLDKDDEGRLRSKQLLVLTRAETEFLAEKAREIHERLSGEGIDWTKKSEVKKAAKLDIKELRPQLKELKASIDTAMFGRMVTSDLFARVDSAVSVAHAFTTHAEHDEPDYFTAVDTLKGADDDAGAGTIQETELAAGVFYVYAVVDMNQLRDNLGDASDAEKLTAELIRVIATHSPGAKRGSTAPYAYAEFVLLERGAEQPRTLASAFMKPVDGAGADLGQHSAAALLDRRRRISDMYGTSPRAVASTLHDLDAGDLELVSLNAAISTILDA